MLVWTLILALVRIIVCQFKFFYLLYLIVGLNFALVWMARTKPKRWSGISWICTYVLPEGQVSLIGHQLLLCALASVNISFFAAFLGKVLKQEQRSKSMRKSARKKLQHQLRYVWHIFSWNWNFSLGNVIIFWPISGSMPWLSHRVCIIFPLLPLAAVRWQAWLFIP